jgi:hypothetical protein
MLCCCVVVESTAWSKGSDELTLIFDGVGGKASILERFDLMLARIIGAVFKFLSEVVKKSWLLIWKVFGLPTFENS